MMFPEESLFRKLLKDYAETESLMPSLRKFFTSRNFSIELLEDEFKLRKSFNEGFKLLLRCAPICPTSIRTSPDFLGNQSLMSLYSIGESDEIRKSQWDFDPELAAAVNSQISKEHQSLIDEISTPFISIFR